MFAILKWLTIGIWNILGIGNLIIWGLVGFLLLTFLSESENKRR